MHVTDPAQPPTCRLAFLKEPRKDRQGNVRTICNLSIDLSEEVRHKRLISPYKVICFQTVKCKEKRFPSIPNSPRSYIHHIGPGIYFVEYNLHDSPQGHLIEGIGN